MLKCNDSYVVNFNDITNFSLLLREISDAVEKLLRGGHNVTKHSLSPENLKIYLDIS